MAIFGVCFGAASVSRSAQVSQSSPSAAIAEIHASGSVHYSDAQVAATSGLKPGDVVTREQLQDAADRLSNLGVFKRVNYKFTTRGNKIVLDFELQDAPTFPVSFDNFPWFSDAEITTAIREALPLFDHTAPQDGTMIDEMTAVLSKLLSSRNIPGTIEHQLIASPSADAMMMQFRVEGPSVTIASIEYGDGLAQSSEKLRDRNRYLIGKPFSRFAIELFETEQVRPLYFSTGHIRVQFGEPVLDLRDAVKSQTMPSTEVRLRIPITAGAVFHFAGTTWSGNNALTGAALTPLPLVKPGELADGTKIMAGWQRVEQEYEHRGYVDVKIDPQPRFDEPAATVTYNVTITEGPQYHMGELVVSGLSIDAERLLRAAWRQARGDPFDRIYFDAMLMKLEKPSPAIFGELPVHYSEMGHWLRVNSENHTMDV